MSSSKFTQFQGEQKSVTANPLLLSTLRDQVRTGLVQLLNGLFDCTDDTLFELADRSSTDSDHHLYFHSMRVIRLQRSEIEKNFLRMIVTDYDRLFQPQALTSHAHALDIDLSNITLVHGDDLEVTVAVSGIVSKATSQFSLPIMELTRRLDTLCRSETLTESTNPLAPQKLCNAFVSAIEDVEVDIRVRLILLKLFERLVVQNLLQLYSKANELLMKAGILPEQRRRGEGERAIADGRMSASPGAMGTAGRSGAKAYGDSEDSVLRAGNGIEHTSFGFIQSLLSGVQGASFRSPEPTNQPIVAPGELIDALNAAQLEMMHRAAALHPGEIPTLPNLNAVITSRLPEITGNAAGQLRHADEDVVNFIGMLFDYILNDRNLAIPMKALIARLQIPLVKLAIIDKTFFERSGHPARQLLNELSSIGIGWSSVAELQRDQVYNMVDSVVARILNEFNKNPEVFSELLESLQAFREREEQRQELTESRVRQTEAGKAQTLQAKQVVQQLINRKASGTRLPPDVGRFVSSVWSRVLVYACLKHGTQSTEWERLVQTLDDLLSSLQPLQRVAEIELRDALAGPLLQQIRAGIEMLQLPSSEVTRWISTIELQLAEISETDRVYAEQDAGPPKYLDYTEIEEIVLATIEELSDPFHGEPPGPAFLEAIDQLTEGAWIELDQDGTESIRCKLTAFVEPGARYVFVNRRGMKVLEKSRLELGRMLQDQRMRILDDSRMFDRALETVIINLRERQQRPSA